MESKSIARKLSLRIAVVTIFGLMILISLSVWQLIGALKNALNGEFQTISEQNAIIVQDIIAKNFMTIENLDSFMSNTYNEVSNLHQSELDYIYESEIYNVPISTPNYLAESYFINNAITTLLHSSADIVELGVYFEPYAFENTIHTYGFHMTQAQARSRNYTPMRAYSEYQNDEFYRQTISEKTAQMFLPELQDDGRVLNYISVPIVYEGEAKGVVVARMLTTSFDIIKSTDERYPSMVGLVLSNDLLRIYDSSSLDSVLVSLSDTLDDKSIAEVEDKISKGRAFYLDTKNASGAEYIRYFSPIEVLDDIWWSSVRLDSEDYLKDVVSATVMLVMVAVIILVVMVMITSGLIRKMLSPINSVVAAAESVTSGNLNIHIDYTADDEIGVLADTFRRMADMLKAIIGETDVTLSEIASGDLTTTANLRANYPGEFYPIKQSMIEISETLTDTLNKINFTADQVGQGSTTIAEGATTLAQGSAEQSEIIENFIKSTGNIGEAISQTREQVEETTKLS
ncbi:MAG: hypothetical protein ATN36_04825, partial [Epulopiscium sp. Nele67-Bin005]